jgi:hypothetical protein
VGLFAGGAAGDVPRCFSIVDDSSVIGDSFIVDKIANFPAVGVGIMSLGCAPHHREIRQKKGEKRGENKREKKSRGKRGEMRGNAGKITGKKKKPGKTEFHFEV